MLIFHILTWSTSARNSPFFQQLPIDIKNSILGYLFDDLYHKFSFFFKEFQQIQNEIVLCLQPRLYNEGSIILHSNCHPTEIFFKIKGLLKIGYYIQDSYHHIAVISEDFIVGDIFALENTATLFEFRAFTKTQGFCIPAGSFLKIIKAHKIHITDYLEQVSRIYINYRSKIDNSMRQGILETEFKDETDKFIEFDGKIAREYFCTLKCIRTEAPAFEMKGIDRIKTSICRMKEARKKLLLDLKDKLAYFRL